MTTTFSLHDPRAYSPSAHLPAACSLWRVSPVTATNRRQRKSRAAQTTNPAERVLPYSRHVPRDRTSDATCVHNCSCLPHVRSAEHSKNALTMNKRVVVDDTHIYLTIRFLFMFPT
uniref:Uncharacterized protein n=1 Tax=Sipha flava TaxID=143950 RepID=A0A2S2QUU9_9HEMI